MDHQSLSTLLRTSLYSKNELNVVQSRRFGVDVAHNGGKVRKLRKYMCRRLRPRKWGRCDEISNGRTADNSLRKIFHFLLTSELALNPLLNSLPRHYITSGVSPRPSCLRRWLGSLVDVRARGPSSKPSQGAL